MNDWIIIGLIVAFGLPALISGIILSIEYWSNEFKGIDHDK